VLELGSTRNEKPLQQLAAIQLQRLGRLPRIEGCLKRDRVAPHGVGQAERAVTMRDQRVLAQCRAQDVHGLVQRGAGTGLVQLGPE
jgi:hypothetical protein